MADFTLLRFQKCSDTFIANIRRSGQWILLWAAAVFSLFWNLGTMSVSGSEGRWLAVAQTMLRTGDWLHPAINGIPYFDKPLVSYWLIGFCSLFTGGVTEFSARMPSACAALLLLGSVISLSRTLFSDRAALITGWLTVSLYSFLFWGRLAEADMENAAFIAAAAAWYIKCRDKKSLPCYLIFWILCAVGAQTKGLAAIVIPACAAGIDMILRKKLLFHLNWKSLAGFLAGVLVFATPFVLESISRKSYDASGILLVVRENIIRAVDPWDHNDEPFWCYFIHVPRLLLPWTPFFLLALVEAVRRLFRRAGEMSADEKWLLFTIATIFLIFTLSRSRRVYYILPIMPFAMILTGKFLSDAARGAEHLVSGILFRITDILLAVFALLLTAAPIGLILAAPHILPAGKQPPVLFVSFFYFLIPCFALFLFGLHIFMRIRAKRGKKTFDIIPDLPAANRVIALVSLAIFFVFCLFLPYMKSAPEFRPQKEFFRSARHDLFEKNRIPPGNVAFFGTDLSFGVYDLDLPENAAVYGWKKVDRANLSFKDDVLITKGLPEFREFLSKIRKEGGAVFLRVRSMDDPKKPEDITSLFISKPGRSLDPAPGVRIEPDSLTDLKSREDAERALASGADPAKSKEVRAYRKILRKKVMYLVFPAPEAQKP